MDGPQIIAHGDFDGIVSAALAGLWSGIALFFYTGPESVRRIEMTARDIVCDLPHPMRDIRAWFDHHASNLAEAGRRARARRTRRRRPRASSSST